MPDFHPLPLFVNGGIFQAAHAWYSEEPATQPRTLTLRVNNTSGAWVDVVIDRSGGNTHTGHIENQEQGGFSEALQIYLNEHCKITRWRPGLFNVAGNGGGDVFFDVPATATDVLIQLTVTG